MNAKKHAQRARARARSRYEFKIGTLEATVRIQNNAIAVQRRELQQLRRQLEDKRPFPIQTLQEMAAGEFAELYAKSLFESGDMRRAIEMQNKLVQLPRPKWYDYDPSSSWEPDIHSRAIKVHHRIPAMDLVRLVMEEDLEYLREQEENAKRTRAA